MHSMFDTIRLVTGCTVTLCVLNKSHGTNRCRLVSILVSSFPIPMGQLSMNNGSYRSACLEHGTHLIECQFMIV
jgi:hypothetical protein